MTTVIPYFDEVLNEMIYSGPWAVKLTSSKIPDAFECEVHAVYRRGAILAALALWGPASEGSMITVIRAERVEAHAR